MNEKFIINGGNTLTGEIEVRGSKNAAGPILAATLLTDKECRIGNLPKISDILGLLELLKEMGKDIEWTGEREVKIAGDGITPEEIDFDKVSRSRVSVLLIGALLPKVKKFKFSRPGGDRIGLRPIDTHLVALRELGAKIESKGDFYHFDYSNSKGEEIILSEFSVTATENLLMAASLTKGTTVIRGAAREPQVQDLVEFLKKMGAKIEVVHSHAFKVEGLEKLEGASHKIIPDPIEAGTFLCMGAAIGENLVVKDLEPNHLDMFLSKMRELGVSYEKQGSSIKISKPKKFYPIKVQALPYPGFPTDLLPLIVPLLTQADGRSLIHDPLYENRLNYVQELRKMGADAEIVDPHRAFVFGKTPLYGVTIESWDIRAGASLVVAALMAKGKSRVENISQIDRGYENLEKRLQKIGADIKRE